MSELPGVRRGNVVAFGVDVDGEEQLVVCCEGAASDAGAMREATAACVAEQFGLDRARGRRGPARVAAAHLERQAPAAQDAADVPRRHAAPSTGRASIASTRPMRGRISGPLPFTTRVTCVSDATPCERAYALDFLDTERKEAIQCRKR